MVAPTARQKVLDFWGTAHHGNPFKASGLNSHSGFDIKKHPAGTAIPLLRAGRLSAKGYDVSYGWWAAFDTGAKFDTYSHMQAKCVLVLGTTYEAGTTVGAVGNTGRLSQGNHLHYGISDHATPARRPTYDPYPVIAAALTTTAGNDSKPIPIHPEDDDMPKMIYWQVGTGHKWAIYGPGLWIAIGKAATVNELAITFETGPSRLVTAEQAERLRVAYTPAPVTLTDAQIKEIGAGVEVDLTAVGLYVLNLIKQQWTK